VNKEKHLKVADFIENGKIESVPEVVKGVFQTVRTHIASIETSKIGTLHEGEDCWNPCGSAGGFCAWCGAGVCCHSSGNFGGDPAVCNGVTHSYGNMHACVPRVSLVQSARLQLGAKGKKQSAAVLSQIGEACVQSACNGEGGKDTDCCAKPEDTSCADGYEKTLLEPTDGCPKRHWWGGKTGYKTVCCVRLGVTELERAEMEKALESSAEDMLPAVAQSFTSIEKGDAAGAAEAMCLAVQNTIGKMVQGQADVPEMDRLKIVRNADAPIAVVSGMALQYRNKLFESHVCVRDEEAVPIDTPCPDGFARVTEQDPKCYQRCPADKPDASSRMVLAHAEGYFCGSGAGAFSKLAEAMAAEETIVSTQRTQGTQGGKCIASLPQTMDSFLKESTAGAKFQVPKCSTDPSGTNQRPAECSNYMHETGCDWTSHWSCPGQDLGAKGEAGSDGSHGYHCCCDKGLWKITLTGTWSDSKAGVVIDTNHKKLYADEVEYDLTALTGDSFTVSRGFNGGSAQYNATAIQWANGDVYARGLH